MALKLLLTFTQGIYNYILETMFLGYIVLKVFCSYNLWHLECYFPRLIFYTFTTVPSEVRVHCPICPFFSVPRFRDFQIFIITIMTYIAIINFRLLTNAVLSVGTACSQITSNGSTNVCHELWAGQDLSTKRYLCLRLHTD
jgi:hypothetical protein